jgi:hypothetical protein
VFEPINIFCEPTSALESINAGADVKWANTDPGLGLPAWQSQPATAGVNIWLLLDGTGASAGWQISVNGFVYITPLSVNNGQLTSPAINQPAGSYDAVLFNGTDSIHFTLAFA